MGSDGSSSGTSALSSAATSTSVSGRAKLLRELQDLQQSNPTEFKQVTSDIASQLSAAAQQAGGNQGQALSSLASQFQQASQTGSLAGLQLGHGHHHHGGGASDGASGSSSSSSGSTAASAAAAAYQQYGPPPSGQGVGAQVSAIISQVLTQDLGTSGTTGSTAATSVAAA